MHTIASIGACLGITRSQVKSLLSRPYPLPFVYGQDRRRRGQIKFFELSWLVPRCRLHAIEPAKITQLINEVHDNV